MRCSCRGSQPRPPRIISCRSVRPTGFCPNKSALVSLSICLSVSVKHVRAVRGAAAAGAPQARPRATELTTAGCWLPAESTAPPRRSSSSREKSTNQARPAARRRLHAAPPEPPPRTMHTRARSLLLLRPRSAGCCVLLARRSHPETPRCTEN